MLDQLKKDLTEDEKRTIVSALDFQLKQLQNECDMHQRQTSSMTKIDRIKAETYDVREVMQKLFDLWQLSDEELKQQAFRFYGIHYRMGVLPAGLTACASYYYDGPRVDIYTVRAMVSLLPMQPIRTSQGVKHAEDIKEGDTLYIHTKSLDPEWYQEHYLDGGALYKRTDGGFMRNIQYRKGLAIAPKQFSFNEEFFYHVAASGLSEELDEIENYAFESVVSVLKGKYQGPAYLFESDHKDSNIVVDGVVCCTEMKPQYQADGTVATDVV